jgi:hypothetical protein
MMPFSSFRYGLSNAVLFHHGTEPERTSFRRVRGIQALARTLLLWMCCLIVLSHYWMLLHFQEAVFQCHNDDRRFVYVPNVWEACGDTSHSFERYPYVEVIPIKIT